jgi:uncharacterized protein (TIGR02270 family)
METRVIPEVVEQHVEQAAFLWQLRDGAVRSPQYTLRMIEELDDRLDANLEGSGVAGEAGWKLCEAALALGSAGEVFVASVLAIDSNDVQRIRVAVKAACRSRAALRGLVSALGWLPYHRVERWIEKLLSADDALYRRIGLAACAVHRRDPGAALITALQDPDTALRARAMRAAGELKRHDVVALLREHLDDTDVTSRFWSAWSTVLLGELDGVSRLFESVESGSPFAVRALPLALRSVAQSRAIEWVRSLMLDPKHARTVVVAVGLLGDPIAVPWLIRQMTVPALARLAAEAFTVITGANLANLRLEGKRPDGLDVGPTENPSDENVAMDPDEHLPWPAPDAVAAWWSAEEPRFANGTRYLIGRPVDQAHIRHVLATATQQQRNVAALELALHDRGEMLFETRAPGFRQEAWLRSVGSWT